MLARGRFQVAGQLRGGRSGSDGLGGHQRGVLTLELLGRAHAPALGLHLRERVGEDLLIPVFHAV